MRRPRSLPGGRAVVGAFLVAASAVGLYAAYSSATARPRQSYVVAARNIAPGARLSDADLALSRLDIPDPSVRRQLFSDKGPLLGAEVLAPLVPGALVQSAGVVGRGGAPGTGEISISIDRSRAVAGTLKAGEYVDLLGTFGSGADAYTTQMVTHVQVISVTTTSGALGDQRTQLITFAAPTAVAAEAIADAEVAAQLTLVRASDDPGAPVTNATNGSNSSGSNTPNTPGYRAPAPPSNRAAS